MTGGPAASSHGKAFNPDQQYEAIVVFFGGAGEGIFHSIVTDFCEDVVIDGASKFYFNHDQGSQALRTIQKILINSPEVSIILVGHSMGGMTAIDTAREVGTSIQLLVTLDPVRVSLFSSAAPTKPANVEMWVNIFTTKGGNDFERNVVEPLEGDFDDRIVSTADGKTECIDLSKTMTHGNAPGMFNDKRVQAELALALMKRPKRPKR